MVMILISLEVDMEVEIRDQISRAILQQMTGFPLLFEDDVYVYSCFCINFSGSIKTLVKIFMNVTPPSMVCLGMKMAIQPNNIYQSNVYVVKCMPLTVQFGLVVDGKSLRMVR
ncbi:hypothetical protein Dsin_008645 [Dipteronia sinensis]|uniref:Uncharacterized protein n=1 Tax=Dipteronia sinensis TaxID=43782 RepID=A0AAE0ECR6_9ROSI|nr:hypothetical protein Dsin_008645 [Dipteronia sinensis]